LLDIELFRTNLADIIESEKKRFKDPSNAEKVLELDKKWRAAVAAIQDLRQKRNEISAQIGEYKKAGETKKAEDAVKISKKIRQEIETLEKEKSKYFEEREKYRYMVGNILHNSVPIAETEEGNELIRNVGNISKFDFEPLNHVELIEAIDGADTKKAAELVGGRFYYLKGDLVLLNLALMKFALDFLMSRRFIPIWTPFFIKHEIIKAAAELADFEEQLYKGQSIGRNILGSPESLSRFKQEDLLRFVSHNYHTDEMVICSVGNISFPRLIKGIEKYFGQVPLKSRNQKRPGILPYEPADATVKKDTYQAHCIIGNMAYDLNDDRRLGLHLLNNMIGGPGLNTRLNMTLREKNGYSYHTESHYSPYSDTGILSVYFSGDKSKLEQSKKVVMKEFSKLREKRLGTLQLSRAKRQLMGQIAISAENHETLMLSMAKSYLVYNKFDDLKEISIKIDRITAEQIMEIANEVLDRVNLSSLTYI